MSSRMRIALAPPAAALAIPGCDYLRPFGQESMNAVSARQAKLDSHEERFRLDRFQAACGASGV